MAKIKVEKVDNPKSFDVRITPSEQAEVMEILADSIVSVATAARKLLDSRLSERAVVILIKDMSPSLSIKQIETVLHNAAKIDTIYTKKPRAKS